MRLLFEIGGYPIRDGDTVFTRPSVRGIIIRGGRVGMVHSLKYDYYKFPGGGGEPGEDQIDTLVREVAEESGLDVIRASAREYGYVHRVEKGREADVFVQDNYYYLCDAQDAPLPQRLDDYEQDERFTLEFVLPQTAIDVNTTHDHGDKMRYPQSRSMMDRESRVLDMLMREGFFSD